LFELIAECRLLFPDFASEDAVLPELAPWERAGKPYTDVWGCVWETTDDGITGAVTKHPLADWNALHAFTPPAPAQTNGMATIDFSVIEDKIQRAAAEGKHSTGSLEQIDNLIRREVEKLGSPEGGFMMIYGLYPGVPLENIKAIMDAMERYATFYS
jgi:hypothetical protein